MIRHPLRPIIWLLLAVWLLNGLLPCAAAEASAPASVTEAGMPSASSEEIEGTDETPVPGSAASEDSEAGPTVPRPDPTLTILAGWPEQDESELEIRAVFTLSDLERMELLEQDYTLLDPEEGAIAAHALGVRLREILESAGINMDDIDELHFRTAEGQETVIPPGDLLSGERYCFFKLPKLYDAETGRIQDGKKGSRQQTETILAWQELWLPAAEHSEDELYELWEDPGRMTGDHAFRLLFGQSEIEEKLAHRAAADISEIAVIWEGQAPVIASPETEERDDAGPPTETNDKSDGEGTEEQTEERSTQTSSGPACPDTGLEMTRQPTGQVSETVTPESRPKQLLELSLSDQGTDPPSAFGNQGKPEELSREVSDGIASAPDPSAEELPSDDNPEETRSGNDYTGSHQKEESGSGSGGKIYQMTLHADETPERAFDPGGFDDSTFDSRYVLWMMLASFLAGCGYSVFLKLLRIIRGWMKKDGRRWQP